MSEAAAQPADGQQPAVITFTEDEYLYGLGTLRLRVDRITKLRSEPGWALVGGVRIDHLGTAREHRDICVPLATLRQHLRDLPTARIDTEPAAAHPAPLPPT